MFCGPASSYQNCTKLLGIEETFLVGKYYHFVFWLYFHFLHNGKGILWQHLVGLYAKDSGKASGLSMVPKLKFEHINLTSFSKMRVDLAAQLEMFTISLRKNVFIFEVAFY